MLLPSSPGKKKKTTGQERRVPQCENWGRQGGNKRTKAYNKNTQSFIFVETKKRNLETNK